MFPFHGIHTEFNASNYIVILLSILVYALLTSWSFIFILRFARPFVEAGLRPLLHIPGLFAVVAMLVAGLIWFGTENGAGLLVFIIPVVVVASFFGMGPGVVLTPLAFLAMGAMFAIVWWPFGAWTGIGWMGLIPYIVFCVKSWRLYV